MKKKILFSLFLIALVAVTGCSSKNSASSKKLVCEMSGTVVEGTTVDSKYTVTYSGDYVNYVETVETVKSNDETILRTYKSTVETMYSPYDNVKYYDYDIKLAGDTLTSTTKINYAKIDTDEMIKVNSANSALIKDGKVALATIKEVYETMGATCK